MKKLILLFALLAMPLLFSCTKKHPKLMAKIDSLATVLDSADHKLQQINPDTVKARYKAFTSANEVLKQNIEKIRTDDTWPLICRYESLDKPLRRMSFNYGLFRSEIDSTRRQLDDLRHDVSKNLLTREEFYEFFTIECHSVTAVYNKVSKNADLMKGHLSGYDTLYPKIMKMIEPYTGKYK